MHLIFKFREDISFHGRTATIFLKFRFGCKIPDHAHFLGVFGANDPKNLGWC